MIRAVEDSDLEAWRELWAGYLRFYRASVPGEVTLATFRRLVAGNDGMVGLVAEDSGRLVALANLVFHPSTWSPTVYCYLEDIFVAPTARGTSVALDLISAVFAEADRKGATRTYWHTQEFNGPARSLYDQVAHPTSLVVYER